jgi:hypothetical protein
MDLYIQIDLIMSITISSKSTFQLFKYIIILLCFSSCIEKSKSDNSNDFLTKIALDLNDTLIGKMYNVADTFYINSLKTTNVTLKPKGTSEAWLTYLIDYSSNKNQIGQVNHWDMWSYEYRVPYDFHPFYIYSHDFQYIEDYLNNSKILYKRLISKPEMDSLFLYSHSFFHPNKERINDIQSLKNIFEEWKSIIKESDRNDSIKKFYIEYLNDGYNFLSKRLLNQSKSSFIYKVRNGKCLLLLELNHGNDFYFEYRSNLKYELNVYQVSLRSPNLQRMLREEFGDNYNQKN